MKNLISISCIVLLALTSCMEEKEVIGNKTSENSKTTEGISFKTYVPKMMKGTDATVADLEDGFAVYAYENGKTYTNNPFINNIIFKKGSEYWVSTPVYYWPSYGLDFFAFYPSSITPTSVSTPTKFSYTVLADANSEIDILMSYMGDQTRANDPVQMDFHHALSKISFIITTTANSGINITANNISLENIPMSADFTFNTTSGTAIPNFFTTSNLGTSDGTATLTTGLPVTVTAGTSNVSSSVISAMYLIPHTLTNWAYGATGTTTYPLSSGTYINISGSLSGTASYTGNIAIPITTTQWQPGMSYTYTIVFGNDGATGGGGYNPDKSADDGTKPEKILLPIQLDVTIDAWDNQSTIDVDL